MEEKKRKEQNKLANIVAEEVFNILERRNKGDMDFNNLLNLIKEVLDKHGIDCFHFDNKLLKNTVCKDITLFSIKNDGNDL